MKKYYSIIIFIISLIFFLITLTLNGNKSQISNNSSDYYPSSNIKFMTTALKLKKNEKAVIKVSGGEKDKVKYTISDVTKIRIISDSYQGIIIERIADFENEVSIRVYNKNYSELSDICYISCYNEMLNCENIFVYKEDLNDKNKDSFISIGDGIYYLELTIETLLENYPIESESYEELINNLEDFFMNKVEKITPKYGNLAYKIDINAKKLFAYETQKTMSFKVDRAKFIYTFQKSI